MPYLWAPSSRSIIRSTSSSCRKSARLGSVPVASTSVCRRNQRDSGLDSVKRNSAAVRCWNRTSTDSRWTKTAVTATTKRNRNLPSKCSSGILPVRFNMNIIYYRSNIHLWFNHSFFFNPTSSPCYILSLELRSSPSFIWYMHLTSLSLSLYRLSTRSPLTTKFHLNLCAVFYYCYLPVVHYSTLNSPDGADASLNKLLLLSLLTHLLF